MKFSESVKQKAESILNAQYKHPFVKGLADGSLPMDKFKYYMIQDTLYIVDYARTVAWVAPLIEDAKEVIKMLDAAKETFEIEAVLKEHYFKQFGVSMEDVLKAEMAPVCKAYIDHQIRYTRTGTLAEGISSILPCNWIYMEIGFKFTKGKTIPEDHPYKSWLETYAIPELKDMVDWWFDIMDRAVTEIPENRLPHIEDIFLKSCRFEWMFWDMAWNMDGWKP